MLGDYLKLLQSKYNYGDELIQRLSQIIPALLHYYGDEYQNNILNALYNCEIHIQKSEEKPAEYLNQYFNTNERWSAPIGGTAFVCQKPKIENNRISSKYIIYIYQSLLEKFDLKKEECLDTLIHEICHLVKSFNRAKVVDGKIIAPAGLMYDEYDFQGNKLNGEYSINVGIEEAINCYDTERITELVVGHPYRSSAYHDVSQLVKPFMENSDIREAIKKAQFGDDSALNNLFGKEELSKLIQNFDVIINQSYISTSDLDIDFDAEFDRLFEEGKSLDEIDAILDAEMQKELDKLWGPYNLAYADIEKFIRNFTSSRQLQRFEEARINADKEIIEVLNSLAINHQEPIEDLQSVPKF